MSDRFATVCLRDEEASLEATFVPEAGMLCSSLRHRGDELLAQNAGVGAYAERGKTMGIPLLYPWANRLAGFRYAVAARAVEVPHDRALVALDNNGLPIHGVIGGRLGWELAAPPGPDAHSLTARLSWSEAQARAVRGVSVPPRALLRGAPGRWSPADSDHRARVRCGGGPAGVRLSPLPRPSRRPARALAHRAARDAAPELDADQIPIGPEEELRAERFELEGNRFDDGFDAVAVPARFAAEAAGRRIELELLEGYPCAQVFAPPASGFICFEPMTAPTNALCSGMGLRLLASGERFRAVFSVRVAQ